MLGHGIGSYVYTSIQHFPEKETWMHQPVHNVLIVAAEIGILGYMLFILLLLILCIKKSRALTDVHVSIVTSLIIIMLTDHYFWTLHQGIFTFWILLALLATLKKYTYVPQRT
jgi:hypothetical protein